MTKFYRILLIYFLSSLQLQAQEIFFHEDFESYEPLKCLPRLFDLGGSISPCLISDDIPKLAEQSNAWTTWNNDPGSNEDVYVVKSKSYSGEQSIYFNSNNPEGGPQNLILPFEQKFNQGVVHIKMKMYIPGASTASFAIKALETLGEENVVSFLFQRNGRFRLEGENFGGSSGLWRFPFDEWFEVRIIADIDAPRWSFYAGRSTPHITFGWGSESIASIQFSPFPVDGVESEFWIDDVTYEYYPDKTYEPFNLVLSDENVEKTGFLGTNLNSVGTILNQGGVYDEFSLHNLEVEYTYGGDSQTVIYEDINLGPNESMDLAPPDVLLPYKNRFKNLTTKITKINGFRFDYDLSDNYLEKEIRGVPAAEGKGVMIEVPAGTECDLCPIWTITSEKLSEEFGERFIGLTSHRDGPMENSDYSDEFTANLEHYTDIRVDRFWSEYFNKMEDLFLEQIRKDPMNTFEIAADFDSNSRILDFSINIIPNEDMSTNQRLFVCLIEDNVTGTSEEYNQANAYSGFQSDLCGLEDLPDPIPAELMVYNDVVRMKLTKYNGDAVLDSPLWAGNNKSVNYSYAVNPDHNIDNMSIVVAMIDGDNDNIATNAYQITVPNALNNFREPIDIEIREKSKQNVEIFPNPANDILTLDFNNASNETVSYELMDIHGRIIASETKNSSISNFKWIIDVSAIPEGVYFMRIIQGEEIVTKKLQLIHR